MYSMTGYAQTSFVLTTVNEQSSNVFVSLKSFNNRYFESTCKLSAPLTGLESEIAKLLKKDLVRGHVYCTIYLDNPSLFQETVEPSLATARAYHKALVTIQKDLNIQTSPTLDHLVRVPNIFVIQESDIDESSKKVIFEKLEEVIFRLQEARQEEGDNLKLDMQKRFNHMQSIIIAIEDLFKKRFIEQKEKIHVTMQEIQTDKDLFSESQKGALYSVLDKLDIQEEITRFDSHLKRAHAIISSSEIEKGKKLDFTLQEMNREINTIGAKCSDSDISDNAINIKVEVEKVREQVQNVI